MLIGYDYWLWWWMFEWKERKMAEWDARGLSKGLGGKMVKWDAWGPSKVLDGTNGNVIYMDD